MNPEVEAGLRSLIQFPTPPGVAAHIIELGRDPDIEMTKVARALSLDSSLASKILRIANSPLYAQRRRSETLRQALVTLGLNAAMSLALSFSLVKSLRLGKPNGLNHPWYWRRTFLAATSARALADALNHPRAEDIFLAALLQDTGMLALDQAVPDLYAAGLQLQSDHRALAAMESNRLQTDHAEVGGWLMQAWNLPERLHTAITRSHQIDALATGPDAGFAGCVALSGIVADQFMLPAEQRTFPNTATLVERSLGLDTLAFGQVLGTVAAMIPETQALFDIESLAVQRPELILEQARDVLWSRSKHALRDLATVRDA